MPPRPPDAQSQCVVSARPCNASRPGLSRSAPRLLETSDATIRRIHRRSIEDRDGFWREQAALIDWQTPFGPVSQYDNPPFAKWFVGGRTNRATTRSTGIWQPVPTSRR